VGEMPPYLKALPKRSEAVYTPCGRDTTEIRGGVRYAPWNMTWCQTPSSAPVRTSERHKPALTGASPGPRIFPGQQSLKPTLIVCTTQHFAGLSDRRPTRWGRGGSAREAFWDKRPGVCKLG